MRFLTVLAFLAFCATAHADALVQARADISARVYVDGHYVGRTPIDVVIPNRGTHDVRFRGNGTRRDQTFSVRVPGRSRIVVPLFAKLAPLVRPVYVTQPVVVTQPVIVVPSRRGYR